MGLEERLWERNVQKASPDDVEKIGVKLSGMERGAVKKVWGKVQALWRLVKDPGVAWKHKALAIGALVYLVSPLDAVPDPLPVVGLLDDAGIIATAVAALAAELSKYTAHQS